MPEPREPIVPPEPACTCHGWPGSFCDARSAAAWVRFGRVVAWLIAAGWAGFAIAMVASAYMVGATPLGTLTAALCGASAGMSMTLVLRGAR